MLPENTGQSRDARNFREMCGPGQRTRTGPGKMTGRGDCRGQMKTDRSLLRLYAVTDRTWLHGRTLEEVVEEALQGGVTLVQLREKEMDSEELLQEALRLKELCYRYHVPLLIDDNVEVCVRADADGVHVGQSDMAVQKARAILGPSKIIGATAHNVEEAVQAEKDGADYLGSGAAFGSATKKDARPIDRSEYKRITSSVHIPVCAIGGITEDNIHLLEGSGLSGVAVISGIFASGNIGASCRHLWKESNRLFNHVDAAPDPAPQNSYEPIRKMEDFES